MSPSPEDTVQRSQQSEPSPSEEKPASAATVIKLKEEPAPPPISLTMVLTFGVLQAVFILLFGTLAKYGDESQASAEPSEQVKDQSLARLYPFFQDVHVMVFVGFGFLMTFLKRYSLSAVGFNMVISAFMLQWTLLVFGFWHRAFHFDAEREGPGGTTIEYKLDFSHKIALTAGDLITADFGAATVMISFGAMLGKAGPAQLVLMGISEIIFYGLNEAIGAHEFQAVDMGGSMFVHMFGAFFGIACSFAYMRTDEVNKRDPKGLAGSTRTTDTFAMIGTLFLWMFWPSFNGALATGAARNRVVINTVLAISASCTCSFLASYVMRKSRKFSMVDVQNATLAGGVAVGSSSDLVIDAWPSLLVGSLAGFVSVAGYAYLQPRLEKMGLHDTCGVLNLHGLPGLLGAASGAISAAVADDHLYGEHIGTVFAARADGTRTASYQGFMQMSCMFTTLGISLASGALTGIILRFIPDINDDEQLFEDSKYWEIEEDEIELIEEAEDAEVAKHQPY